MADRWFNPDEYQLENGTWAPRIDCHVKTRDGVKNFRLNDPHGQTFPSQADAKAFSSAMGTQWLNESPGQ
jgi:hypothetical protein